MRLLSGDHDGLVSAPPLWVSRCNPCPSDCISQIDRFPSIMLSKAMRLPSGDQAGLASKASGRLVRVWGDDPSTPTTKTCAGTIFAGVVAPGVGPGAGVGSAVVLVDFELWLNTA